jgi:hypothetical protein
MLHEALERQNSNMRIPLAAQHIQQANIPRLSNTLICPSLNEPRRDAQSVPAGWALA